MSDVLNGLWADRIVFAGVMAGVLSLLAYIPYIMDTLARRTQPDRATWLIWAVLASISGASNLYEGATVSLIFIGVQVAGTLIIFGLSMTRGSGSYFSPQNVVILIAAAGGLIAWYLTHTALYALILSIGISALGGSATVWKAFRKPRSETYSTWIISTVAACLGVVSVGGFDPLLLAYPLYLVVLYGAIVLAMTLGLLTGQTPYHETFIWRSGRARAHRMPPPVLAPVPVPSSPASAPAPASFRSRPGVEAHIR